MRYYINAEIPEFLQKVIDDEHLRRHRLKFQPCLDEINEIQNKRDFVIQDIGGLLTRPFTKEKRLEFYEVIDSGYKSYPCTASYQKGLNLLGGDLDGPPGESLRELSDHIHNNIANPDLIKIFAESRRVKDITKALDFDSATELMANAFLNLPNDAINAFSTMAMEHEKFALVTMEPYMVFILGKAIFLKLFVPLHTKKAFTIFINHCIDKRTAITSSFAYFYQRVSQLVTEFANRVYQQRGPITRRLVLQTSSIVALTLVRRMTGSTLPITPPARESTVAREVVDAVFSGPQGFNSPTLNLARTVISNVFYEVGAMGFSATSSFFRGALSRYEGPMRTAASEADANLSRRGVPPSE